MIAMFPLTHVSATRPTASCGGMPQCAAASATPLASKRYGSGTCTSACPNASSAWCSSSLTRLLPLPVALPTGACPGTLLGSFAWLGGVGPNETGPPPLFAQRCAAIPIPAPAPSAPADTAPGRAGCATAAEESPTRSPEPEDENFSSFITLSTSVLSALEKCGCSPT